LTIDREGGFNEVERRLVPALVPTQQAETSEQVALGKRIAESPIELDRLLQHRLRMVVPPEQRAQVTLALIRLGQLIQLVRRFEEPTQLVDDSFLPSPESEGFTESFLPEQDVDQSFPPFLVIGHPEQPALGSLQDLERLGVLTQSVEASRRQPCVVDRLGPAL